MADVRRPRSRRPWEEMDHEHELLREEIVLANRVEERGPIPEFLAKKRAEQAARFGGLLEGVKVGDSRRWARSVEPCRG